MTSPENGLYYGSVLLKSTGEEGGGKEVHYQFFLFLTYYIMFHYGKGVKVSLNYLWSNQERRSSNNVILFVFFKGHIYSYMCREGIVYWSWLWLYWSYGVKWQCSFCAPSGGQRMKATCVRDWVISVMHGWTFWKTVEWTGNVGLPDSGLI